MRPQAEGFAVLLVLALLAVIGLYTASTLHNSLFGRVLAGTRVFQQRAFVLADLGIEQGMQDLSADPAPTGYTRELHPVAGSVESTTIELRLVGEDALPGGFSIGRFVSRRYEIHSTGVAARGARAVQVQGASRVLPAPVAP